MIPPEIGDPSALEIWIAVMNSATTFARLELGNQ
jgi:hypothetical protein